jgi:translation initiation factor IF-1
VFIYFIAGFLMTATSACSDMSGSGDAAWLYGVWELTHNPDHDDSDTLVFKDDGTVKVQTEDGREIHGKFAINDNQLKMTLATGRDVIDVEFTISKDKSKLIYRSGAYYTRQH